MQLLMSRSAGFDRPVDEAFMTDTVYQNQNPVGQSGNFGVLLGHGTNLGQERIDTKVGPAAIENQNKG